MSKCNIDHSIEDVQKKLSEQKPFLPVQLFDTCSEFLKTNQNQSTLNELFHFLKKYDLATDEGKVERNVGIKQLVRS